MVLAGGLIDSNYGGTAYLSPALVKSVHRFDWLSVECPIGSNNFRSNRTFGR
jgi:hypothetical protein